MKALTSAHWQRILFLLGTFFLAQALLNLVMQLSQMWLPASAHADPLSAPLGARIPTVLVSSLFVSFFALAYLVKPGGGRDWRSMGLVQAFIVALYAEMYGFPLTVYLLASVLGVPMIPGVMGQMDGHLVAQVFYFAFGLDIQIGSSMVMAMSSALMALGFSLIFAGWIQIHRSHGELVTDGIYAYIRHPQYTGILLLTFALVLHWPTLPTVLMYPFIVSTYVRLARREERLAEATFGQRYVEYRQTVPAFIPRLRLGISRG